MTMLSENYNLDHPMVNSHRLPIQNSWASWAASVPLTVVFNQDPNDIFLESLGVMEPTEEELVALAELNQRKLKRYNSEYAIEKMKELPLDLDPGINVTLVAKTEKFGWVYRQMTWTNQILFPGYGDSVRYNTVEELIEQLDPSHKHSK